MLKNFNVYIAVLLLSISAGLSTVVTAEEKAFLTVDELIADGYIPLSGEEILQLMNTKNIRVVDIETEAVTTSSHDSHHGSKHDKSADAMDRKFKIKKGDKASSMLDARLLARAPALEGKIERKVVGDALVATDGVRTYKYHLYKKQQDLYAVRDIDNGNVFFKVEVK